MVRGAKTGNINVFHNTCTHRGAAICRADKGSQKVFQCFYHAWTFDSEGELKGVPGEDAYVNEIDRSALGLAKVESYRGFVFCTFDPEIEGLVSYLAGAKDYLDYVFDSMNGAVEVVTGTNEYGFNANWRLLVENSIDAYHAASTHDTYFKYLAALGTDLSIGVTGVTKDLGQRSRGARVPGPVGPSRRRLGAALR